MAGNIVVPPVDDSPEAMAVFYEQLCNAVNDNVQAIEDVPTSGSSGITVGTIELPANLSATGGHGLIVLSWDMPTYTGHSHTIILRSQNSSNIANAEQVGSSSNNTFTDVIPNPDISDIYYYWIYFVALDQSSGLDESKVTGPTSASVTANVSFTIDQLLGQLGWEQFSSDTMPVRLVDVLPNLPDADWPEGSFAFYTINQSLYMNKSGVWSKQLDGAIVAADISGQFGTDQIANGAITSIKIQDGSITAPKIVANSIGTTHLVAGSVTANELATNSITAGKIATGAIIAEHLAAGSVTADAIAAGAISADSLGVTSLSAISANLGAITAGQININNRFVVSPDGSCTLQSATSGERMVINNTSIKVYDASNNLRVIIGDLNDV